MKRLPHRLYIQIRIVISGMIFFVVLGSYLFNVLSMAQTTRNDMNQVSGLILFPEEDQIPINNKIVIQLLDVSLIDKAAVKISEAVIENVNDMSIPFTIPYDRDLVKPSNRYAITVDIYARQEHGLLQRVFRNTQHYPVILENEVEYLQIMVQRL